MDKQTIIDKLQPTLKSVFKIVRSTEAYNEDTDIKVSKVGGIPYWPKGKDYPILEDKKAKLIFQLNIDEAKQSGIDFSKAIPEMPETGILQFFFPYQDDMWGYESDISVVYHEDTSAEHFLSDEDIQVNKNHDETPFDKSTRVSFTLNSELLGPQDLYNQMIHEDLIKTLGLDDESEELYYDIEEVSNHGSKVGGYAYFTQWDPLDYLDKEKLPKDIVLLLQLDSDDELSLLWGDCGVANWRISAEKLKNRDFSDIHYNWDCS